jgi:hypothetical protein
MIIILNYLNYYNGAFSIGVRKYSCWSQSIGTNDV